MRCATSNRMALDIPAIPRTAGRERVVLPGTEQWSAHGAGGGYRIFLGIPDAPAPPSGFPMLVVLDANATFATVFDSMRMQSRRPARTRVDPTVIVGIGYPTDDLLDVTRRQRDFTDWARPSDRADQSTTCLYKEIERSIVDDVASRVPLDPSRQALFGHSLGGLFVLHLLFTQTTRFNRFIAASPSIWWDDLVILREEAAFADRTTLSTNENRLLITVGEQEEPVGPTLLHSNSITAKRMIGNAREMVERLRIRDIDASYLEFAGENHASVLPAALARALRFLEN